jgi:hypothetical protein
MAVGRLSGAWIRQVLTEVYPNGVARRALLDHFAALLVTPRSSRGAKGRLARRLYKALLSLQRRGLVRQAEGVLLPLGVVQKVKDEIPRELGPVLERRLFRALLAEDGQGDGHTPENLWNARWHFLSGVVEAGWTVAMGASLLGLQAPQAAAILERRPVGPEKN